MSQKQLVSEKDLVKLAKKHRKASGKTRAQAARDMKVSQTSIFHAEESPAMSLSKLRARVIEKYSLFTVVGPMFLLKQKRHLGDSK